MYYETELIIHDLGLNIEEKLQLENMLAETEPEPETDLPEDLQKLFIDIDLPF